MKKRFRFKKGDDVICIAHSGSSGAYLYNEIYRVSKVYEQWNEERINTYLDSKGSTTNGWCAKYFIPAYQLTFNFGE